VALLPPHLRWPDRARLGPLRAHRVLERPLARGDRWRAPALENAAAIVGRDDGGSRRRRADRGERLRPDERRVDAFHRRGRDRRSRWWLVSARSSDVSLARLAPFTRRR